MALLMARAPQTRAVTSHSQAQRSLQVEHILHKRRDTTVLQW